MVYERRPGETFLLGASTWRIEDITYDRVVVTPGAGPAGEDAVLARRRPGPPARAGPGRRRVRARGRATPAAEAARAPARARTASTRWRRRNLLAATSTSRPRPPASVPDDRTIVVERFRDEIGDWRVCVLSPFGAQVHAPWAMALQARLARAVGHRRRADVERRRHRPAPARGDRRAARSTSSPSTPTRSTTSSVAQLPEHGAVRRRASGSARPGPCCCPGAAPTGARRCGSSASGRPTCWRWPARYPTFPILLEATRECLNDVFDLPALREVLARPPQPARCGSSPSTRRGRRRSPSRCCSAGSPSTCTRATPRWPSAGPRPWRSTATCCATCSAPRSCASCSTPRCSPTSSSSCSAWSTAAGPATPTRSTTCCAGSARSTAGRARRPQRVADRRRRRRGRPTLVARAPGHPRSARRRGERAPRRGRGRGPPARRPRRRPARRACPPRSPTRSTRPLDDLVARFARTHGPFLTAQVAARARRRASTGCAAVLERARGRRAGWCAASSGPSGVEREWCDDEVLRQLRRRSLAALRREVEPVDGDALARFLPGVAGRRRAAGAASTRWSRCSASSRARRCRPRCSRPTSSRPGSPTTARPTSTRCAPPARWCGSAPAAIGAADGRVRLRVPRPGRACWLPRRRATSFEPASPPHEALLDHLGAAGRVVLARAGRRRWPPPTCPTTTPTVLAALWDLVWAGLVTNDSLAPLRALGRARRGRGGAAQAPPAARPRLGRLTRLGPAGGRRAGGRWWRRCSSPAPSPTEARPRPGRASCSSATACSPARRRWPRASRAASPACTRCCKALEERGQVRRGYFVAGLGAAQFALPGAVDRLRAFRAVAERRRRGRRSSCSRPPTRPSPTAPPCRGPTTDGRPAAGRRRPRRAGRRRAGRVPRARRPRRRHVPRRRRPPRLAPGLVALLDRGRYRSIEIRTVDGQPVREQPDALAALHAHGWVDTYKGVVRRR